jgi:hypothetical protein
MKDKIRKDKAARAAVYLMRILGPINCGKIAFDTPEKELVRIRITLAAMADDMSAMLVKRIQRQANQLEAAADLFGSFICRIAAAQIEKAFTK